MRKTVVIVAAMILGLALMASAQPGSCDNSCRHDGPRMMGGKMGGGHGMMGRRGGMGEGPGFERILAMADKAELTDAQRTKLKTMHETFQLERIDRQASVQKAQLKLRGLMRDDKAPTAEINKAIDDASALKAEMAKMRVRHHADMKSVLTEKQQQMLNELRVERRKEVRVRVFDNDDDLDEMDEPEPPPPGTGH